MGCRLDSERVQGKRIEEMPGDHDKDRRALKQEENLDYFVIGII